MSEVPQTGVRVDLRENDKLGVWMFLGGEVILFTTLILTFLYFRFAFPQAYADFRALLNVPLVGITTGILIVSSFLAVLTLNRIRSGDQAGLRLFLLGVIVFGATFLGGQLYEWATLFQEGVSPDSVVGSPFLVVTGVHGTHVFIGLIWASIVLVRSLSGAYTRQRSQGIDVFGLYWHFVDIVWIILFSLIYLL